MLSCRKVTKTPTAGNAQSHDRISALPDDLLHHVLSFLPVRQAVQTSLLSARWRHLWTSLRALRFNDDGLETCEQVCEFINHVLLLRDASAPLETCEFCSDLFYYDPYVTLWIRHALLRQVRVLYISDNDDGSDRVVMPEVPLRSQHLKKLKLTFLNLKSGFLDFSHCPALEDLDMDDCLIEADRMLSPSLKRLNMHECCFPECSGFASLSPVSFRCA